MDVPAEKNAAGIGLPTCIALVMATMVGTGVYTTLGFQLQDLKSGFSILCLWALGGLISLCGALSYAELAARIPRSGGEYTYLGEIYHPALGFMAGFVSLVAGFAAPIALSSIAFGSYLQAAFPLVPASWSSALAVLMLSLVHMRSLRVSAFFQLGSTALKFLLAVLFIAVGLAILPRHSGPPGVLVPSLASMRELVRPSSGIALIFVLYAYSGWNATAYLASEVRKGRRTVGLSLVLGTVAVTLFYLVLNAVFLKSAPLSALCGVLNVGSVAAEHLLGRCGGRIMSLIVALGLLASLSAMIWSGPRVTQRVGENHAMLGFLAAGRRNGIPVRAIQLQLLIVLGLMACGSFETVLVFAQIPLLLCLMLGVAGLIVIRQGKGSGEPSTPLDEGKEAAFRCPLYPLPPLVFLVFSLAGLLYSVISRPWVALAGTGIMMLSLILYPWISRKQSA